MIWALFLLPAAAGLAAFFLRDNRLRKALVLGTVLLHAGLTASCWVRRPAADPGAWLALDAMGLLFLSITSLLFVAASFYGLALFGRGAAGESEQRMPGPTFAGCYLLFHATASLVAVSQHLGVLWVAIEATTLATAPLIFYQRSRRSLEATWKYLMICSVGIAVALLGIFFLAVSTKHASGPSFPLVVGELVRDAYLFNPLWLKLGFALLLVGYGTKMGLAPMHTWLPDAHSEAPSVVSALLSGTLLNCAFLAILRAHQVCVAAGQSAFSSQLLVFTGLLSMAVAAVFILGQSDYKRLLAYSSVEHMGILALGVGLGGAGLLGALLHTASHSAVKALLFLTAGNLLHRYGSKAIRDVRGAARALPFSGAAWIVGFLAITGAPPFGLFLSELTILRGALDAGRHVVAGLYLALLALIFIGMGAPVLRMALGEAPADGPAEGRGREPLRRVLPIVALGLLALLLGTWLPEPLRAALVEMARSLGAK